MKLNELDLIRDNIVYVTGSPVTALTAKAQIQLMLGWASQRESRVVCVANTHMLVEAHRDQAFRSVLEESDIVTPDGMPLVWMLSLLGVAKPERLAGLDILLALSEHAPQYNIGLFFVGTNQQTLSKIRDRLEKQFPKLCVSGMEPLPYRSLTEGEEKKLTEKINNSGAGIVLVALGCPKQEKWMMRNKYNIRAVMIGVGGAFPVYAGNKKRAPHWMQEVGLEWLYRLIQEPRRLWRRYITTIPVFVYLSVRQLLNHYLFGSTAKLKHYLFGLTTKRG